METHSNKEYEKDDQDVDRISNLPDTIRSHILSLMPSKSALKMSILSKQWRYLWTQVPVLDFSEMPKSFMDNHRLTSQQINHYKNFVRKLLSYNDVPLVRFLHLDFGVFCWDDTHCINLWLDTIAKRDIHKIVIAFMPMLGPQVTLPTYFLSRERLVDLELIGKLTIDDKMPIHLPNLKSVNFTDVEFPNDDFLKRLLSSCLVLEKLNIAYCTGIKYSLFVESFSLRILTIWGVARESERVGIIIKTPNLKHLFLDDTLKQNFIAELSSLDEAFLSLDYESVNYVVQVLESISTVTTLSLLNCEYFGFISKPPIFQNLTYLDLDRVEKLFTILSCAPKLQYLIFRKEKHADESLKSEAVPVCMSSLEVVVFYRFDGEEEEFELVAYFLKYASILKEMRIYIMSSTKETDHERLSMLPKSSSSCQLIIE